MSDPNRDASSTLKEDGTNASILILNDDCLLEIFKQLELPDQVRLAMICPRLRNVFQYYCQRHYKVLQKDDLNDMSAREIRRFFEMAGSSLEELINLPYTDQERNEYVTQVHKNCPNVLRIYFGMTKIKSKCLRKLLMNMKHLTSVHLQKCSLDDNAMQSIAELATLEVLKLEGEEDVTGRYLSKLKCLKELTFVECGIQDDFFVEICTSLKGLKKLTLQWCEALTDVAISALPVYCINLEKLNISCNQTIEYYAIAQLPKLIDLELSAELFRTQSFNLLLNALAEYKGEQLQCLRIFSPRLIVDEGMRSLSLFKKLKVFGCDCSKYIDVTCLRYISSLKDMEIVSLRYCRSVTNEAVLELLDGCPKLKYVNVMHCDQLTEELVYKTINLLESRHRGKQPQCDKSPLLIMVAGTRIRDYILEDTKYLTALDAGTLRLSFENPFQYPYENLYYTFNVPAFGDLKYFY
ncbi:F-box/LRR-repeat protein 20-like isoform X1 [Rhagoletis pomonella]|uniref:F-box/LRR-repeat protein 20-like isoform X1 n=1 Tax=Rhagoletis pomonella TaxID=28610 RepID=UPI0017815194|nr:F-box/LRR-repeat protein 20-like isoform X1 [Rhagoletis pomonella]